MQRSFLVFGLLMIVFVQTEAAAPARTAVSTATGTRSPDVTSYANANNVLGFVTNYGNVFYDASKLFGKNDGFYFPYTSVADILSGVNKKTVVFDAGVWLGGQIGGQTHVSVAEYSTEFVPGPMSGGTFAPDDPSFRVYHLYKDSMAANPNQDYLQWPVSQGAPIDGSGKPLLIGDQTLWSVYNDANPSLHNNQAGSTSPLGVEVQQTTWSIRSGSPIVDNTIFVKYKFYNKGLQTINNFYVSFWADPDVGTPTTDLVGCDTVRNEFFAYKGTATDGVYGIYPPAWGGRLLSGLVVPAPGSHGTFDGHVISNFRNLPMTAFDKYINGTDPHSPQEAYNYMRGLLADGTPYTYNGMPTRFFNSGDPVSGTGDIDVSPADRRLMMTCGPVTFLPGDSQQLVLEVAAAQGTDRLSSVTLLKQYLDSTYAAASCDHAVTGVSDFGKLVDVRFEPLAQQWLTGESFGASYFHRSAGVGTQFFGSALDPAIAPDSFPTVEVRFSRSFGQMAYRYTRPGYGSGGYCRVPFSVWDVDHNRQLNAAFVEDPGSRVFDSTWDLDDSAHYGGREYLFIFNSTYSGTDPANSATAYLNRNIKNDAPSLDILYGGWFVLAPGHTMAELSDGQKIVFETQSRNKNGIVDVLGFRDTELGRSSSCVAHVACSSSVGFPSFSFESTNPDVFSAAEYVPPVETSIVSGIMGVREMASSSGPVDPPSGRDVWLKPNSTGDWMATNSLQSLDFFNYGGGPMLNDWEVRFTSGGSECYDLSGVKQPYRVPFELWDIGDAAVGNPAADRRLTVAVLDLDGNGVWSWGDRAYAVELAYQEPGPDNRPYITDSISLGRITFQDISHNLSGPQIGTVVRYLSSKLVLSARLSQPRPEPDFHGASTARPADPMFETSRNLKLTFAPPSAGSFSGDLYIRDSLSGQVIKAIYLSGSTAVPCCSEHTGDVNGSGFVDLGDLTYLVTYLTRGPAEIGLPCQAAANVDSRGIIDLGDLSMLVAYLTGAPGTVTLPLCPVFVGQ